MSRPTVIVAAIGLLVVGAPAAVLISLRTGKSAKGTAETLAVAPSDLDKLRRAEQFFGGNRDIDVRGGQEMKPRW